MSVKGKHKGVKFEGTALTVSGAAELLNVGTVKESLDKGVPATFTNEDGISVGGYIDGHGYYGYPGEYAPSAQPGGEYYLNQASESRRDSQTAEELAEERRKRIKLEAQLKAARATVEQLSGQTDVVVGEDDAEADIEVDEDVDEEPEPAEAEGEDDDE
ncbi:hypothetical protein ACFLZY_00125 [Patescibacteria group bacterium]